MLDIKFIQENTQLVKIALKNRGVGVDIDQLLDLYNKKNKDQITIEQAQRKINEFSDQIKNTSEKRERENLIEAAKKIKTELAELEPNYKKIVKEYERLLFSLPNIPLSDVPVGKNENDNVILRVVEPIKKNFPEMDYLSLAKDRRLIDTDRAAKTSGSRFGFILNEAAFLEIALVQLAFTRLREKGFQAILPPVLINEKSMRSMGYLEHGGEDEIYFLPKDELYLIGTAEQAIGAFRQDETFNLEDLPLRYVGFSSCFRREAGSYGKDTRGILRVHQFDKVEMFSFTTADKSLAEHEFLLSMQEQLVKDLKLPHRVLKLCTGDIGTPSAKTYDIECWLPSENRYRETHSTSNCTDWQARRLKIYYQDKDKKKKLVHTLNGTFAALGRLLIVILENYQNKDGSIDVPKILRPYLPFKKIRAKN